MRHPTHGPGQVIAWRRGGRVALVRFEGAPLPVEVPARELGTSSGLASLQGSYAVSDALRVLEAMRLGVVPEASLDAYTVGRETELALVDADLAVAGTGAGAVRAMLGDYGVGKTHLLELMAARARQAGFLSSLVMLDATETPPSHPKRVYRALVRGLRYPDAPQGGLAPLLDKAVEAGVDLPDHLYLSAAIAYWRTLAEHPDQDASSLLLDWIEGHPTLSNTVIDRTLRTLPGRHPRIYSLRDFRPWARIYGYLLSGLSTLARAVGYHGLVALIDEAEFYALLSRDSRGHAAHLFKAWSHAAVGAEGLPFATSELEIGGQGVLKTLPGRYGDGPGLYVVYAMTPNDEGLQAMNAALPAGRVHTLTRLEIADYIALSARLCDFTASAWPDQPIPAALVGPLGKLVAGLVRAGFVGNARQAMKFVIGFLDIVRYRRSDVPRVIQDLQRQLM